MLCLDIPGWCLLSGTWVLCVMVGVVTGSKPSAGDDIKVSILGFQGQELGKSLQKLGELRSV